MLMEYAFYTQIKKTELFSEKQVQFDKILHFLWFFLCPDTVLVGLVVVQVDPDTVLVILSKKFVIFETNVTKSIKFS